MTNQQQIDREVDEAVERIVCGLNETATYRDLCAKAQALKAELVDECIPPEVRGQLQALDMVLAGMGEYLSLTEANVKSEALTLKQKKIQGEFLEVGYSERDQWNVKALPGFAAAHPEILKLRSITPVASIRKRSKK